MEPEKILQVWQRGQIVNDNNPSMWRKDSCGAWIKYSDYGNRQSHYGWEVDHIIPNGNDSIYNLQPLQWTNNLAKSDGRQVCVVSANGIVNMQRVL